jgi:hypothetical protein
LLPDDTEIMFMRLEQERTNENADEWLRQYGFPHNCHCADDVEEGKTVEIPECYADAASNAFDHLREARGVLWAIAQSDEDDADVLKQLAAEAFHGPDPA